MHYMTYKLYSVVFYYNKHHISKEFSVFFSVLEKKDASGHLLGPHPQHIGALP